MNKMNECKYWYCQYFFPVLLTACYTKILLFPEDQVSN